MSNADDQIEVSRIKFLQRLFTYRIHPNTFNLYHLYSKRNPTNICLINFVSQNKFSIISSKTIYGYFGGQLRCVCVATVPSVHGTFWHRRPQFLSMHLWLPGRNKFFRLIFCLHSDWLHLFDFFRTPLGSFCQTGKLVNWIVFIKQLVWSFFFRSADFVGIAYGRTKTVFVQRAER